MPLTILAQITATPGKEALLRAALEKLVTPTRGEVGCITYDLHVDDNVPGFFVFYETWETRALWQDHMKALHLVAHQAATQGMTARVAINEMTKIG